MEAWIVWLTAAAGLLVIEVLTQMMWALCLTVGAVAAMVCALFGLGIEWQVGIMAATAVLTYLIFLPVFRRWHARNDDRASRTGMDALLGRHATVTHEIKPGSLGRARIDGDNWQVKAPSHSSTIPAGTEVVVTAYDSIILTVETLSR